MTTVVASRNRRDDLLATLPHHEPPVILVDNASTDGTTDAVRGAFPTVQVIPLSRNHGAPARNLGVEAAQTPYVAFADDDSWWAPDSLTLATKLFEAYPGVGLLAARILVGPEEREDAVCATMSSSPIAPTQPLPGPAIRGFVACAAVVRREAFLEAGGFDEVIFFPGEEARLALDLVTAGWELCYCSDLVVHHHPSPSRHPADTRRVLIARNEILTAVMRRPWRSVLRTTGRVARQRDGRRGVVAAIPRVPAALSARHRLPPNLERDLRTLDL